METSGRTQRRWLSVCLGLIALCAISAALGLLLDVNASRRGEIVGSTLMVGVAAVLVLPATAAAARGRWSPLGPLALILIYIALAALMLSMWTPWTFQRWKDENRQAFEDTTVLVSLVATVAGLSSALAFARVRKGFRWVVPATIVSMLLVAVGTWFSGTQYTWNSSGMLRRLNAAGWVAAVTVVSVPASVMIAARIGHRTSASVRFRWMAAAVALPLAVAAMSRVPDDNGRFNDVAERALGAMAILAATGLIGAGVLHWMTTMNKQEAVYTTRLELRLFCPRCNSDQTLPAGHAACRQCGLKMKVEIEEEQCPKCHYVLFGLASPNCPECGAEIADRWTGVAMPSAGEVAGGVT